MPPSIICSLSVLHSLPPEGEGGVCSPAGTAAGTGAGTVAAGQDIPERQFSVTLTKQFERKTQSLLGNVTLKIMELTDF